MRELGARWPSVRDSVERAVAAIRSGRPVVVVDADRQNEGDLIFAAEHATTELLAFVIRHTSGFVCVALPADDCNRLDLPPMSYASGDKYAAAYRVSVDLRGRGTGISAADRATTIAALASSSAQSAHFTRPGHVVPLAARDGGVLQRPGRTEQLSTWLGLRACGQPVASARLCRRTRRARWHMGQNWSASRPSTGSRSSVSGIWWRTADALSHRCADMRMLRFRLHTASFAPSAIAVCMMAPNTWLWSLGMSTEPTCPSTCTRSA